ncbi:hypothetical protein BCR33DRAFT_211009 [Rhizoclosmatium globosum]|uniref:Uncharacterized protein n=1 Tax=Rhizoclosmatium globosum TaxID=329046 RepID=A0A1Y2CDE8_9FUNG|nr:hypothetical protein BCR33DRAFT_211009 [Rhizoclosmatium globosum]|eukprot:ORY44844.1 hypothetical protein BCR33DRAFT_211009 [Rhizoclosmatium globosum]
MHPTNQENQTPPQQSQSSSARPYSIQPNALPYMIIPFQFFMQIPPQQTSRTSLLPIAQPQSPLTQGIAIAAEQWNREELKAVKKPPSRRRVRIRTPRRQTRTPRTNIQSSRQTTSPLSLTGNVLEGMERMDVVGQPQMWNQENTEQQLPSDYPRVIVDPIEIYGHLAEPAEDLLSIATALMGRSRQGSAAGVVVTRADNVAPAAD